ncbi:transposase [Anaerococcus sp. AGMB00486]|uniref:Transposase n=1 Tax=Anaerococcus faecalis TaxID=2742993 RepID=A0ABX2N9Q6_9FIRM|nr:transposase [Anaerococcus faecalis]
MCTKTYSKLFVLSLTKYLGKEVKLWRNNDLSIIKYPYLLVELVYIKLRENYR